VKIVSLLPSATEIICQLGLRDQLVGVTHECDYPPDVSALPKVTHTLIPHDATSHEIDILVRERLQTEKALYTLNQPLLEILKPDLIVTQALCDVCAVAADEVNRVACALPGSPQVINLEPMCLEEVFQCLELVGVATNRQETTRSVLEDLRTRVDRVATQTQSLTNIPQVVLLEWIDPLFSCGHWSPELVRLAGGREMIGVEGQPSRTSSIEALIAADPEVLVIACCGFGIERTLQDIPILKSYPGWENLRCVQNRRVYVIDGNAYFSRPGPRLVDSLELLGHLLHPELFPRTSDMPVAVQI
jgi:iron complex transport system substrate-binding protein